MMVLAVILAMATLTLPKDGPRPPGHSSSGDWCVPQRDAGPAVPRVGGSCPSVWASSGRYCLGPRLR
jgi:hypothetical protein